MNTRPYQRRGYIPAAPQVDADRIAPREPTLGLERRRLVIVDAHGHAFRAFWALEPMYAPDGLPTNALYGLAGLLKRIVFEERPDFVAVVFDAPDDERRTFRTGLYPAYKAHRPERPPELARQIPLLRDVARALGLHTLEHPDFEADDIVATIVAQAEAANLHTTILSADKDLLQLVSDRTLVWDAMRGKRYTLAAVEEKLGVPAAMVADYLALVGDASDNVPGVPGIGPKGAATLLRTWGTLEAVYAAIEDVPVRERKKLVEHRERAVLSQTLTRLRCDVPLQVGLAELELVRQGAFDTGGALWERLGFDSFIPPQAFRTRRDWRPDVPAVIRETVVFEDEGVMVSAPPIEVEVVEPVGPIEIIDLKGLMAALQTARASLALGLAMRGEALARDAGKKGKRGEGIPSGHVPPVLGLALPSGASWRIHIQGGERGRPGRPIQGSLFPGHDTEAGLALSDVAAALSSLLADTRRVLCVHDGKKMGMTLGIATGRIAHDVQAGAGDGDPAMNALEALSCWLEADHA